MGGLHTREREEWIIPPVLNEEASPGQPGQVRPVREGPQTRERAAATSGRPGSDGTSEENVAIMQATTQALTRWSSAASSRLRPPPPENPKVDSRSASTPGLTRQDVQRHQIIGQHRPGQGLPESPGRLGEGVLVKSGGEVELLVRAGGQILLTPQGRVRVEHGPRVAGWDGTDRTGGCPRRTCRGPARRSPVGPTRWRGLDPNTRAARSWAALGWAPSPSSTSCSPPIERTPPWQCMPSTPGRSPVTPVGRSNQPVVSGP